MDARALIFDISRTDNTDWLVEQREEVETNECYSENDRVEIRDAINQRFSQLNLLAMAKNKTEGNL